MFSTSFILIAVLLVASHPLAFQQSTSTVSEGHSLEAERQAEALFQSALLLYDNQERESARLRLQEAMHLWVQMREPGKAAKAALQLGDRGKQARKYQDALDYYQQALEVKSLPGQVVTNALNAIAQVYADLYQGDLAIHYFQKALKQARLINDLPAQMLALTGLANLYYQRGEKAQALVCIAQARQLNQQKNADAYPALLCLLGRVSQEEGSVENAKGAFEEALAIYEKTRDVEGQVKVLCSMSALSLLSSQNQAALEQAQQAVELAENQAKRATNSADRASARELQRRAWLGRARAERALGQEERALKSYSQVTKHSEALWWAIYIATEASAMAFIEEVQAGYREYVDLLIKQGQSNKAYELADLAKARAILNFTEARRVTPPSGDSNREAIQRELFRSIARLRLQLLPPDISPEEQARLQKDIEDAEFRVQEAQLQYELAHSKDRLVWSPFATAEQLQKKMAQDQMALAEFSLGENRSFVWLFIHGDVFFEILPARKEIEKEVRSYLEVLAATPSHLRIERDVAKLRGQAGALFSTLFGRLARHIQPDQRLIVVPDGLLHYLPFETLVRNERYLIEDHEISYNPSASVLGLWQDSGSSVESDDKMELLAIGDPVFEPQPAAIGGKGFRSGLNSMSTRKLIARGPRLARLPRTQDEVQYIANLFPPDRRKVFLGRKSTEEAIKNEPLRRYRRLHFATHSLINEKSPLRSAVMLTPEGTEDGALEVSEISRLNLDCDLLVVSACQTGRGQLLSGEGIVGLSRAFLYAGARSVVVSLWNVSDISTSQFMKNFYQHLVSGSGNPAALREAKLQMIRHGRQTRHPYYWAPFVIVGKP